MAPAPPPQCQFCRGMGWRWELLPNGEWRVQGRCPECKGSGLAKPPPEPKEGEQHE